MSADGSIEVAVRAEGVDEATEEMADEGGSLVPGGGDGGGEGGGGGGIGGMVSSLMGSLNPIAISLAAIAGILAIMPGMLQFLKGIFKVLQAFLAPLSLMLMRLFMPVLRILIQLLPAWFAFMDWLDGAIGTIIDWAFALPGMIWDFLVDLPGMIWDFMVDLPGLIADAIFATAGWLGNNLSKIATVIGNAIWDFISSGATWITDIAGELAGLTVNLAKDAIDSITGAVDDAPSPIGLPLPPFMGFQTGGMVPETGPAIVHEGEAVLPPDLVDALQASGRRGRGQGVSVTLSGGLPEFVSNVESNQDVDFQPSS